MKYPKRIFCIEGNWDDDFAVNASVRPVLELLDLNAGIKFIYRDCSTLEEIEFLVDRWRLRRYAQYRLLYLAFHGRPGELVISSKVCLTLEQLGERLGGRCRNRLVYFGACSVLDVPAVRVRHFLDASGAKAVCGYNTEIDWMKATALDLIAMRELQNFSLTRTGLVAAEKAIRQSTKALSGELGFRMVYR
ncbi:MAG TPA: hypothetical protein ENN51_01585 [candidate division WOR-3 bacterium]|uniref:Uncharacterized protein n=1 Tax=candidate division WOR-3 bacterium TaxID=2052148 RepID=A0A7V0T4X2_UNCW3|nr:hypothetical protein [candidate division WOR-3 bacterium]